MSTIKPTAIFTPFSGRVEIRMYGMETGNWSLKQLDDIGARDLRHRIGTIATDASVKEIYAPRPKTFNAVVTTMSQCSDARTTCGDTTLYHGAVAEGIEVPHKHQHRNPIGVFFTAADCAVVVLHDPESGKTVASHAGRDSLIDRALINLDKEERQHSSVIDVMVSEIGTDIRVCRAFICGAQTHHPHSLDHSEHGRYNKRLLTYLREAAPTSVTKSGRTILLSITALIKQQLIDHGVPQDRIGADGTDVYSDKGKDGKHLWWSHQRWLEEGRSGPDGRNGILVIRHW